MWMCSIKKKQPFVFKGLLEAETDFIYLMVAILRLK